MCKSERSDLERLADDVQRMVETRLAELLPDRPPTIREIAAAVANKLAGLVEEAEHGSH